MTEPTVFEIADEKPVVQKEEFTTEGLSAPEIELAKKNGLVKEEKKEDANKVEPEVKTEDNNGEKEVGKNILFEDVDANEKLLDNYSKNEKALYWKWKNDKRKRQEAQKKIDELQSEIELSKVKDVVSVKKLKQINQVLSGDAENITVEKLKEIIGELEDIQEKDENAPLTIADLKKIEKSKTKESNDQQEFSNAQREKLLITEKIGVTLYPDFENAAKLADELVKNDKTGIYQNILLASFKDEAVEPEELVERIMNVARLNPKFGKPSEKEEKKIEIKQEPRKIVSSANLSSGSGKRTISEDEMTVEDAARLTSAQWGKLKKETKERLMRG